MKSELSALQFKEFTALLQTLIRVFEFIQRELSLLFDQVYFEFFTNLRLDRQYAQIKYNKDFDQD